MHHSKAHIYFNAVTWRESGIKTLHRLHVHVFNVILMTSFSRDSVSQVVQCCVDFQAEEYGSHDKTFESPGDGAIRVVGAGGAFKKTSLQLVWTY